jgi:hypothetical protein
MKTMPRLLAIVACAGMIASTAGAQPADDSNISFQSSLRLKKPKQGMPDVKAQPQAWPRLDAGSVLCRSESDLSRLSARRSGQVVSGSVDCQVMRGATPITIVQRKGPGRTEVTTTDPASGGAGWTDAWLPEKAPNQGARPR